VRAGLALIGPADPGGTQGPPARRAFDALEPGGALAVFGHHYGFADESQAIAIDEAFADGGRSDQRADRSVREIAASGQYEDVVTDVPYPTQRYLRLVQTYSPFLARSASETGGPRVPAGCCRPCAAPSTASAACW
jgi:hypothetical protein